jgi:hypothetical protein
VATTFPKPLIVGVGVAVGVTVGVAVGVGEKLAVAVGVGGGEVAVGVGVGRSHTIWRVSILQPSPALLTSLPMRHRSTMVCPPNPARSTSVSMKPPELPVHAWRPARGLPQQSADRAIVTALLKGAASCEDVLEWTAVDADL